MRSEVEIDRLVAAEVADEPDENTLALSVSFLDAIDAYRTDLSGASDPELEEIVRERLAVRGSGPSIGTLVERNRETCFDILALADFLEADALGDVVHVLPMLGSFRYTPSRTSGVPEHFVAISGEQLAAYVTLYERAVGYIWREECPPCDLVREDLVEVLQSPPEDLALFAVYGPDHAEMLHREFDVAMGPTTLFLKDGRVDARVVGAPSPGVIKREIEILREE